jgi:hypothetical protein
MLFYDDRTGTATHGIVDKKMSVLFLATAHGDEDITSPHLARIAVYLPHLQVYRPHNLGRRQNCEQLRQDHLYTPRQLGGAQWTHHFEQVRLPQGHVGTAVVQVSRESERTANVHTRGHFFSWQGQLLGDHISRADRYDPYTAQLRRKTSGLRRHAAQVGDGDCPI